MSDKIREAVEEIREFYLTSDRPIILAVSFGKDSMTVLELCMLAISELPVRQRTRKVVIESVDTLVEAPPMRDYLQKQIRAVKRRIRLLNLPMEVVLLHPAVQDTFFVSVIGKGYKTPDHGMRWCTDRLKIQPVNRFLRSKEQSGGVYIVTGQRRAESANRARSLDKYTLDGKIKRDGSNANNLIYTPIEDWTTQDVWDFLRSNNQFANDEIEAFYEEANEDGNIYSSNRMGCWVCTVVKSDKALEQFCGHGYDLSPLLRYREMLVSFADDKSTRYIIRRKGETTISLYTIDARIELLRGLLIAQKESGQSLIGQDELKAIDECWRRDFAPVTVRDVWRSVYEGTPLVQQSHFAFRQEAVRTLTSKTGNIEALFAEVWEPGTFVEVTAEANGGMRIVKGVGHDEMVNGKSVWVIDNTTEYCFAVESTTMVRDFFAFAGFSVMPGEEENTSLFTDQGIVRKSLLFENSYWRVSREPGGMYYCAYGVYQPSRFGDTHYKILGRASGENLSQLLLEAREEFLANSRIFRPMPAVMLTLRLPEGTRRIRVNRLRLQKIGQDPELLNQLLFHLDSINGHFLRIEFNPAKVNEIGRLMLKSIVFAYGGLCEIRKRAKSWVLIPVHCLAEFGPMAAIAIGAENVTGIDAMKCRYKYNRRIAGDYQSEQARAVWEQEMANVG